MDYLVVAPHTPFFQWQVALLVESFRMLGMEENLAVLLVAGHEEPVQSAYCNAFSNHPRLRAVRLLSDSDPDILRLHGLANAVSTGLVSQTFALLPPHCVLRYRLDPPTSNVTISCKDDFTFGHLDGFGISSKAICDRLNQKKQWLPVGDVFLFNGLLPDFFNLVAARGEMIAFDSYREILKRGDEIAPKALFRAAMSMTIMEAFGRISVDTSRNLECHMNEHNEATPVVNYYYGSPPQFSRAYYPMDGTGVTFSDDPYNGIWRSESTAAAVCMKRVVVRLRPDLLGAEI